MKKFIARDLINQTDDDIWYISDINELKIEFDDGVEVTTGRCVLYSWFFWEYHRQIENIQILKKHLVPRKKMTSSTHPEFLEVVMWSVYDQCHDRVTVQTLKEIAYEITNKLFNKLSFHLEKYVTSSCMLDYLEIMEDEKINELIDNTPLTPKGLIDTKHEIKEYLKRPDIYQQNQLKKICEADLVNWGQLLQAVAYRGYTTDADNYFFPNPIMKGYAHGITKLHDSLIESTSSTKSLIAQDDALRQTEFFNKRMQLVSQIIRGLVAGDCGSTHFNRVRITDGEGKHKSNFKSLIGKYYLKEDGELAVITKNDTHLIGERLKIRSVMNCKYRHTCHVCQVCYGELHLDVPEGCNLGYFSAVAFCQILSQNVMSTKHHDNAAAVDMIYLEPMIEQIFDVRKKEQDMTLKSFFTDKSKLVTIVISPTYNDNKSQLNYLEDLELIDEITNHTVMRKSDIKAFTVTVEDIESGELTMPPTTLTIGNGNDGAYLSKEMLEHIKKHGWAVTAKGDYEFDLKDFPDGEPVFTLPKKHMNTLEFKNIVSKFMESSGTSKHRSGERLIEYNNVENGIEAALNRFLEIVNEKVTVNIAHLELFLLVFMARDPKKSDARIPKLGELFKFISSSTAFNLRSMGPVMPFKDQCPWLSRVESYDGSVKVSSPFDAIMAPEIFNK